jgi:hypothetical protein
LVLLMVGIACLAAPRASADAVWQTRPYDVTIAIDATASDLSPAQRDRLAAEVEERVHNRLPGFWRIGHEGYDSTSIDKRFDVAVTASGGGYRLIASEKDALLDSPGLSVTAGAAEAADLPERVYTAVLAAFRPIAIITRDPNDAGRVSLEYRAAERAPSSGVGIAAPGTLLLPYRRQLDREGGVVAVEATPWTYLVAEPITPGEEVAAKVISHSRRPFMARTGGRVEQLAIGAPVNSTLRTRLRLHAHDNSSIPLPGYEVNLARPGETALRPLGLTGDDGAVLLPPGGDVWMAHIRCGAIAVASIPVAPGIAEVIDVPLVDERARLRAELEVTALREELIDTVARRKILGERIRRLADAESIDAARKLLSEFDSLPGMSDFARRLDAVQRGAKAPHPIAKARLDKLFEQTRAVVNSALDARESRELSIAIDRAQQAATAEESPPPQPAAQDG